MGKKLLNVALHTLTHCFLVNVLSVVLITLSEEPLRCLCMPYKCMTSHLHAVFFAPFHSLIPDIEAVHIFDRSTVCIKFLYKLRIFSCVNLNQGVRLAVLPLENNLCRHRHTQQIKTMISDLVECLMHIDAPHAVKHLRTDIIAEPVDAGEPDLVAVHIHDLVALNVQPVIVTVVCRTGYRDRRCRHCRALHCEHDSRHGRCHKPFPCFHRKALSFFSIHQ